MLPGDIIIMVDGRKVFDTPALMEGMARAEPGMPVRLSVLRAGGLMQLPVMLWGPPPAGPSNMPETRQAEAPHTQRAGKPWLGISTESLAPEKLLSWPWSNPARSEW